MSSTKSKSTYTGVGFPGLLTLVFITLKLTGVIGWSWFWVISPLLVGPAILLVIVVVALLVVAFSTPPKTKRPLR